FHYIILDKLQRVRGRRSRRLRRRRSTVPAKGLKCFGQPVWLGPSRSRVRSAARPAEIAILLAGVGWMPRFGLHDIKAVRWVGPSIRAGAWALVLCASLFAGARAEERIVFNRD